jgi:adenylate kinase
MNGYEVIYLTGHPASGKTTLVKRLTKSFPMVHGFVYSELLASHLSKRSVKALSQAKLRKRSANIVAPEDIKFVDDYLINEVRKSRRNRHVLIDSHAVTKEDYGFRVTAFSLPMLKALNPTKIYVLFTDSTTVINRIKTNPKGRPNISKFEADFHCFTQAALAVVYGVQLGIPVYFYDNFGQNDHAFGKIGMLLGSNP